MLHLSFRVGRIIQSFIFFHHFFVVLFQSFIDLQVDVKHPFLEFRINLFKFLLLLSFSFSLSNFYHEFLGVHASFFIIV